MTGDVNRLLRDAAEGHRGAVARLITVLERGDDAARALSARLPALPEAVHLIGVTGAPGAGKSSLTGHLLNVLVADGARPAVIAVDPSSSVTGGAILGDRVRMPGAPPAALVRSMATRGWHGGLAVAVPATARLLALAGFGPVIVETTGVGQVEVDIAAAADTTILVTASGWGDAIQANKAGLLELADLLVVNKADLPGAREAHRDLEAMLDMGELTGLARRGGAPRPQVLLADSVHGTGVAEVARAVAAHRRHLTSNGGLPDRRRRQLLLEVTGLVEQRLRALADAAIRSAGGEETMRQLTAGHIPPGEAARRLVALVDPTAG
ncbi:MAG: methylmalonyl Co-A mutase-associated GTPase MeaB [Thermoleophilia bacterium]